MGAGYWELVEDYFRNLGLVKAWRREEEVLATWVGRGAPPTDGQYLTIFIVQGVADIFADRCKIVESLPGLSWVASWLVLINAFNR